MQSEYTIGILGGMGSYATLHFFSRILDAFPAEKEWERPRVIIDNRCTMPSRVRAYLYGERKQELVAMMADSVMHLCDAGADSIILACNTSHLFLEEVKACIRQADRERIVNMIELCACNLSCREPKGKEFYCLATEGTMESGIYQKNFERFGMQVVCPREQEYHRIRELIEAVKQNCVSEAVTGKFLSMLRECGYTDIILGCTELPVLYQHVRKEAKEGGVKVYDPLEEVIGMLKEKKKIYCIDE